MSDTKINKLYIEYAIKHLKSEMTNLIEQGVVHFVCGSDHGLNFIAAGMTVVLRELYPAVTLSLVLPCAEYIPNTTEEEKNFISDISREANEIHYLYDRYERQNMRDYSRYFIDTAMYCISFTKNQKRAAQLKRYAQSKNRQVIELADTIGI